MSDYQCPACGGGFPASDMADGCPWCGESMDGREKSSSDVTTPVVGSALAANETCRAKELLPTEKSSVPHGVPRRPTGGSGV